ncbi:SDR family oxidoreductase [Pseudaminobacter sp. 19-2017]|uniref:SDR family oxidoreductase n=1 Tax=Pseudaminobacter soli (ex Zhang et al. 2022) TaxID=2831468 RepID=A0A942IAI3_9HYPH|nr:SDR family oxidoreductase [Pseudaminobacter soli]MBS3650511.1 SDR family oxidoreductase [Pseudaminobacter soli]
MSISLFDLTGRIALITGSTRGLGRAIAQGLAEAGAKVVLNGTNGERVVEAVAEFRDRGLQAEGIAFNVTDEAAVVAAFRRFDDEATEIDILVNNAGIQWRKPMLDLPTAEWQRVLDVNLTAAFVIGREAGRRMVARGRGKIINIASTTSTLARATIAPYAVSKGGLKLLTQEMAAEWAGSGVQANAIAPGYMITEMNTALLENRDFSAWVESRTPSRRWGRPEELIGTAVFLASFASDYVNGQLINVDGGMTAVV